MLALATMVIEGDTGRCFRLFLYYSQLVPGHVDDLQRLTGPLHTPTRTLYPQLTANPPP